MDTFATVITILLIVIFVLILMSCWYLTFTECVRRKVKYFTGHVSGVITRHVRVYDFSGGLLEEYKGTFDIETTNDKYLLLDDQNNSRRIVYFTTGTVIIDELGQ